MADKTECDNNCGKVVPYGEDCGWILVERIGIRVYGEKDKLKFCTWDCLCQYASAHKHMSGTTRSMGGFVLGS